MYGTSLAALGAEGLYVSGWMGGWEGRDRQGGVGGMYDVMVCTVVYGVRMQQRSEYMVRVLFMYGCMYGCMYVWCMYVWSMQRARAREPR